MDSTQSDANRDALQSNDADDIKKEIKENLFSPKKSKGVKTPAKKKKNQKQKKITEQ